MFNPFSKSQQSSKTTKTVECKISGMHCTSCAMNIDGALEDLPGVVSADTSYAKAVTKVVFDESQVDVKTVQKTIEAEGYTISGISTQSLTN